MREQWRTEEQARGGPVGQDYDTRERARRLRVDVEDIAVAIGIGLVTLGAGLAWPPAAFIILGVAILAVVRYGSGEG